MKSIPPHLHESSQVKTLTDDHSAHQQKALGMIWNAHSDIARTFDVLGWIAPSTVLMKVLFQRLWKLKLSWDEDILSNLQQQHALWKSQLFKNKPFSRSYSGQHPPFSRQNYTASRMPLRTPTLQPSTFEQCIKKDLLHWS